MEYQDIKLKHLFFLDYLREINKPMMVSAHTQRIAEKITYSIYDEIRCHRTVELTFEQLDALIEYAGGTFE